MSARIAAVRLGRTGTGEVVLADDVRSAYLLAAQGTPIPAGYDVPDEWIFDPDARLADRSDAETADDEVADEVAVEEVEPADEHADEVEVEDEPASKPKAARGKKTW